MDPDVELIICAPPSSPIIRARTCVNLSTDFNRILYTDPDVENALEIHWEKRKKENPKLFNGTKFRVHDAKITDSLFTFDLGITCYRDFLGTNWGPNANFLLEKGEEIHNNSHAFMSDALGVGSLVESADGHVILLRRSLDLAEAAGLWDIPGGHAEPEMLVGKVDASDIVPESLDPEAVKNEIFDSVLREITDEVNIPLDKLSDPELIGIARNTQSAGRPSVEFLVRCNLPSSEIIQLYNRGDHAEADESTSIQMVKIDDLWTLQDDPLWKDLAPSAKGCISLYLKVFETK